MFWDGVYIPISYKYDLSVIYEDAAAVLQALLDAPAGELSVVWPSNTFNATWQIQWGAGEMRIVSEWGQLLGGAELLLRNRREIALPVADYLAEWKRVLMIVHEGLEKCGYGLTLGEELTSLKALASRIPQQGILYRSS